MNGHFRILDFKFQLVLLGLLMIGIPNRIFAQNSSFPYELNKTDWFITPLGICADYFGESLIDNQKAVTIEDIGQLRHSDVNWFDRPATYNWSPAWDSRSDDYRNILTVSTAFVFVPQILKQEWKNLLKMSVMYAEAYYVARGLTSLAKGLSGRKRPYAYNEAMRVEERYAIASEAWGDLKGSFFSGHACEAFTEAVFVSKVFSDNYPDAYWTKFVWGGSLILASLTGYARYESGEHYLSDVIVGAIVGSAVGYLIPEMHKRNDFDKFQISIAPCSLTINMYF
ncbi:MAG: phosphatase PAP2 family protein [Calditrichaceae bacterium]|nr:phosphatase PAP2 family protein [Calditrichaceae bacterium]